MVLLGTNDLLIGALGLTHSILCGSFGLIVCFLLSVRFFIFLFVNLVSVLLSTFGFRMDYFHNTTFDSELYNFSTVIFSLEGNPGYQSFKSEQNM